MIALWPPQRSTHLLALLCLALCGVIAAELTGGENAPVTKSAGPARPPAATDRYADPRFALPPAATYAAIEARPLFSDTRRPAAGIAAAPEARAHFLLVGTIISKHGRVALIRHGQPARVDHVAEGQSLDGWTIRSILPDRVVFGRGQARLELKEKADGSPPHGRRE